MADYIRKNLHSNQYLLIDKMYPYFLNIIRAKIKNSNFKALNWMEMQRAPCYNSTISIKNNGQLMALPIGEKDFLSNHNWKEFQIWSFSINLDEFCWWIIFLISRSDVEEQKSKLNFKIRWIYIYH